MLRNLKLGCKGSHPLGLLVGFACGVWGSLREALDLRSQLSFEVDRMI